MQKCAYPQYIGSQYFWQFSRPKSFPTSTKNRRDVFTLSFSENIFLETIFFLGCVICRLWPSHSDDHKKTSLKTAKAFFSLSLSHFPYVTHFYPIPQCCKNVSLKITYNN